MAVAAAFFSFFLYFSAGASLAASFVDEYGNVRAPRLVETGTRTLTGYDEFWFIGWNDSCAVAYQYLSFPPVGEALQGVPVRWDIGSLDILPGEVEPRVSWVDHGIAGSSWDLARAQQGLASLSKRGYYRKGRVERIRQPEKTDPPELDPVLLTTASFQLGYKTLWPPANFKLRDIYYSPLATCAFFVFRDLKNPRDSHAFKLVRIQNPGIRHQRSRIHVSNGLLLYQAADIYGSLEELSAASAIDPDYALARYHHSVILTTHGRNDEALDELAAALKLDPRFAQEAKTAIEFRNVRKDRRFKALLRGAEAKLKG